MAELPRIAVGMIQPEADGTPMLWALMDSLQRAGLRVQNFLSHAYFTPRDGATAITGLAPRHLDSWIMTEAVCRETFLRGASASDLAIVEGRFEMDRDGEPRDGGDLDTLCRWLDLPRLAIVDVRGLSECRLPPRPAGVTGLLLDRVENCAELFRFQTLLETIWNIPVVGSLGALHGLRDAIAAMPSGAQPPLDLCHALGEGFRQHANLGFIQRLAAQRPFPFRAAGLSCALEAYEGPLRVAVAYDDAFRGYFPDTLDLLELRGATVCEFSPLRDERLPADTDIVYFGCGHPERFLPELAENDCMLLALKGHLCSGRRMYSECGGLAYLCQQLEMPDGLCWPMVGALPVTAQFHATSEPPKPVELSLSTDTWLAPAGAQCRGYLNPRWTFIRHGELKACAAAADHRWDMVQRHQALGCRAYLNFAAQPALMNRFFQPHRIPGEPAFAGISPAF